MKSFHYKVKICGYNMKNLIINLHKILIWFSFSALPAASILSHFYVQCLNFSKLPILTRIKLYLQMLAYVLTPTVIIIVLVKYRLSGFLDSLSLIPIPIWFYCVNGPHCLVTTFKQIVCKHNLTKSD